MRKRFMINLKSEIPIANGSTRVMRNEKNDQQVTLASSHDDQWRYGRRKWSNTKNIISTAKNPMSFSNNFVDD